MMFRPPMLFHPFIIVWSSRMISLFNSSGDSSSRRFIPSDPSLVVVAEGLCDGPVSIASVRSSELTLR